MSDNGPVTLTTVPTEQEAAIIVAALADRGIIAHSAGDITAGFRAEAPGMVQVLVKASDLAQARDVIADHVPDNAPGDQANDEPIGYDAWRHFVRILVLLGLVVVAVWAAYSLVSIFFDNG